MDNPNAPKEIEPEIIVTRHDEHEKEVKPSGFFSELNNDGTSNKKLFAIVGGVLGVAMISIFAIDAFMLTPTDTDKNLDLTKQLSPSPKEEKKEVAGTETNEMSEKPANTNSTVQLPKKPSTTKVPVATVAPTAAPTAKPTDKPADPTATPSPTTNPTETPTVVPTDITPSP
jgi:cytoskeletal protein RodZ